MLAEIYVFPSISWLFYVSLDKLGPVTCSEEEAHAIPCYFTVRDPLHLVHADSDDHWRVTCSERRWLLIQRSPNVHLPVWALVLLHLWLALFMELAAKQILIQTVCCLALPLASRWNCCHSSFKWPCIYMFCYLWLCCLVLPCVWNMPNLIRWNTLVLICHTNSAARSRLSWLFSCRFGLLVNLWVWL